MYRYVSINFAALAVYILYPMAPPWLASREGYLPHGLHRITGRGWDDIGLSRVNVILDGVGNPVAAMPSLHAGIAFLVAVYAVQRLRSPYRWVLLAYPVLMGFALVYFAEHYVIDIVAGWLLAVAVLVGCNAWERSRRPARHSSVCFAHRLIPDSTAYLSISIRTSSVSGGPSSASRFVSSCSTLEAPMTALVTRGSRSTHCRAS